MGLKEPRSGEVDGDRTVQFGTTAAGRPGIVHQRPLTRRERGGAPRTRPHRSRHAKRSLRISRARLCDARGAAPPIPLSTRTASTTTAARKRSGLRRRVEQRLGFDQIRRVEALGEPAVDRGGEDREPQCAAPARPTAGRGWSPRGVPMPLHAAPWPSQPLAGSTAPPRARDPRGQQQLAPAPQKFSVVPGHRRHVRLRPALASTPASASASLRCGRSHRQEATGSRVCNIGRLPAALLQQHQALVASGSMPSVQAPWHTEEPDRDRRPPDRDSSASPCSVAMAWRSRARRSTELASSRTLAAGSWPSTRCGRVCA